VTTLRSWSSSTDTMAEQAGSAVVATVATGGSYTERINFPASTAAGAWKRWTLSTPATADHNFRMVYTMPSLPTSSFQIASGADASNVNQWRLDSTATGTLRIRNAANAVQTPEGTVPLVPGTEYIIKAWRAGSLLTVKAYKVSNGALVDTVTGTVGTSAIAYVYTGNNAPLTGTLGAFSVDELLVTDQGVEPTGLPIALSATATLSPTVVPQGTMVTLTITATGGTGTNRTFAVTDWGDGAVTGGVRAQGTTSPAQASNVLTRTIPTSTPIGDTIVNWTVVES
jgi:hypothetical protein